MLENLLNFLTTTGFHLITWQMVVMWAIAALLLYLAVAKGFEPLLLVPIAFGALIANLPTRGVVTTLQMADGTTQSAIFRIEGTVLPSPHADANGSADEFDDVDRNRLAKVRNARFCRWSVSKAGSTTSFLKA